MKSFKEVLPAIIVSAVMGFMLFLYEPITLYCNNVNDFVFKFSSLVPAMVVGFLVTFLLILALGIEVYYICRALGKVTRLGRRAMWPYYLLITLGFATFIAMYIEGNFLAENLPSLGSTPSVISWDNEEYNGAKVISGLVWIVVFVIALVSMRVVGLKKTAWYGVRGALIIVVMLTSGMVFTVATTGAFSEQSKAVATTKRGFNEVSTNKNFYILLTDTVSGVKFDENVLNSNENKEFFRDFTFFKDTVCGYPATIYSVPLILSGMWNENKTSFSEYSTKALDEAPLFEELEERGYKIGLYRQDLVWKSDKSSIAENLVDYEPDLDVHDTIAELMSWQTFRYAPFEFKRNSGVEVFELNPGYGAEVDEAYDSDDKALYEEFTAEKVELVGDKVFNFIYADGTHLPFNYDKDFNEIQGNYDQKLEATNKMVKSFITRLKKAGVYDNSVIVIMSDHGYDEKNYENPSAYNHINRQNPALLIKGINEKHSGLQRSELQISFTDFNQMYVDLLDGKKSGELFADIEVGRKRRYLWYDFVDEEHLVEYEQTGKAWEAETMVPTGRKFDL